MADRFWSFDGDSWQTHETAEEARSTCERALDWYRDDAGEGWAEEVEYICWGPIAERVEEFDRHEHLPTYFIDEHGTECDDECQVQRSDIDYTVNYRLVAVMTGPNS